MPDTADEIGAHIRSFLHSSQSSLRVATTVADCGHIAWQIPESRPAVPDYTVPVVSHVLIVPVFRDRIQNNDTVE
jgi:hypothetical protein